MKEAKLSSRGLAYSWPYPRHKTFENLLRRAAERWFSAKGYKTHPKMGYCLADRDQWHENIICSDVVELIEAQRKQHLGDNPFPLHKYLHHGLSSQAMAFNLVGPLVARDDLEPLRLTVECQQIAWPSGTEKAKFEYEDREVFNEDTGQPTSIDVTINSGLFLEVKLVERGFGGCSVFADGDCEGRNPLPSGLGGCYLHHISRKYWQRMIEQGFNEVLFNKGPICPFANYYQFFREFLFTLANNGTFILLHDERNPTFFKVSRDETESGLYPFLLNAVPEDKKDNVRRITVQQLVRAIENSGRHGDWIGDFKVKYGLDDQT